jgi:hypothetical protein
MGRAYIVQKNVINFSLPLDNLSTGRLVIVTLGFLETLD